MDIRHNWQLQEVIDLFSLPFNDLIFKAASTHRENHDPNAVQVSTLMSIKTGGCAEDCKYCPQSASYDTPVKATKLSPLDEVKTEAAKAKAAGATRFCMGAAWRSPKDKDLDNVIEMVKAVKDLGLESCVTLGMLKPEQAQKLADAGLDYYNHNIDTSPEYYGNIITTRTFEDRLNTLEHVREAGMKTCTGGIVGMGEQVTDRASMLMTLANMKEHPHSVPINLLVKVEGTPFAENGEVEPLDFVRTIAVARILMPKSAVRLSAGREGMSDELQALCFLAGANSIFYGEKLLTTPNPEAHEDRKLFEKLGIRAA
jgi:biotin synthase